MKNLLIPVACLSAFAAVACGNTSHVVGGPSAPGGAPDASKSQYLPGDPNEAAAAIVGDNPPSCRPARLDIPYALAQGQTEELNQEFLKGLEARDPYIFYCDSVTNDQLISAGRSLITTFPALCNGIKTPDQPGVYNRSGSIYKDNPAVAAWPPELLSEAIKKYLSMTNGGPVGQWEGSPAPEDKIQDGSQRPLDRQAMATEGVQIAAVTFC